MTDNPRAPMCRNRHCNETIPFKTLFPWCHKHRRRLATEAGLLLAIALLLASRWL